MSSTMDRNETAIEAPRTRTVAMKLGPLPSLLRTSIAPSAFTVAWDWRLDADFVVGKELPRRTVHTSRVAVLDSIRQGRYGCRTRLGQRTLSRRVRHRGSARRAGRMRCRSERSVPSCRAGRPPVERARIPTGAATLRSPRSAIPTATAGCCRRSPARLPGRVDANDTTYTSSTELAKALRRAEAAHGEHEKRTGQRDANWPDWYAEYMVNEQAGKPLPT